MFEILLKYHSLHSLIDNAPSHTGRKAMICLLNDSLRKCVAYKLTRVSNHQSNWIIKLLTAVLVLSGLGPILSYTIGYC